MVTAHYIFDPMCGWCYGAAPLIGQLSRMDGVRLALHPGGMIRKTAIDAGFRRHILDADQRIEAQTGQVFGAPYLERVAGGAPLVLDSYITAQAVIAAGHLGLAEVEMLHRIQQAHYQSGLPVYRPETLSALAGQLGIGPEAWAQAMSRAGEEVEAAVRRTRQLMEQLGLGGFPSMLMEREGQWQATGLSRFYGRPDEWRSFWQQQLA